MRLLKSNLPICFIFSAPTLKIYVGALEVKKATLPQSGNLKIAMNSGVVFMCNKHYGVTDLFIVNYGDISAFTHKFDGLNKKTPITYEDGCVVIKNLTNIAMPFTYKAILLA